MSILPWNNWIYHIDDKKQQLSSLYREANALNGQITTTIDRYNGYAGQYRSLAGGNAALLIINQVSSFTDEQYRDYVLAVDALPDPPAESVPLDVVQLVTNVTGMGYVAKGIFGIGKLVKNGLLASGETSPEISAGVTEGAAEAGLEGAGEAAVEGGVEAGVETGVEAALADTGVGIILAVGMDALIGAFQGEQESDQLDASIAKLQDTLGKLRQRQAEVNQASDQLNEAITNGIQVFRGVLGQLSSIQDPGFTCDWEAIPENLARTIAAQTRAVRFYGPLVDLRTTYLRALQRSPTVSKQQVIEHVLDVSKSDVTEPLLERYWAVLAQNSTGMQQAA